MKKARKAMTKLCEFLEKKLYDEPTYEELQSNLDRMRFFLWEAREEICKLQILLEKVEKKGKV